MNGNNTPNTLLKIIKFIHVTSDIVKNQIINTSYASSGRKMSKEIYLDKVSNELHSSLFNVGIVKFINFLSLIDIR